jgi:2-iminobutanoate/2-iminopropanoate deaminase
MQKISTPSAPAALGHYEQAIVHGGLVFASGQLAIDPATGEPCPGTIEEQTRLVLQNLEAVLIAAGSGKGNVLKTTVYISDMSLFARMNAAYAEFFGNHKPARASVPIRDLPKGFLVEIEAVATVG